MRNIKYYILSVLWVLTLSGCIKNDLPYPKIPQNITALAAEGEQKSANIDSLTLKATVYLEETVDIRNVKFTQFQITEGATSNLNLLDGTWDLSTPLYVTVSKYQDYDWEIEAVQDIARYFQVDGEVGESIVDPVGHRVVVHVPMGTDLANLRLLKVKLGPEGLTTMVPDIKPGIIDLSYPMRVEVTAFGITEIWTIYCEVVEAVVTTSSVDPWSQVLWAYGSGPSDVQNSFQYRRADSDEWIDVPMDNVTQTQGAFSVCIPHLTPLTEYAVRAVSGNNKGNEIKVTTQATADIPDGDFEQWHQTDKKMWCPWNVDGEQFWDTGNTGTMTLGVNNTEPSDDVPAGLSGKSVLCKTRFVGLGIFGKLGAGSIFTGVFAKVDGTNGILNFGRPWNLRPTKLKGYYKYQSVDIDYASTEYNYLKGVPDSCHIYVAVTDWTAPYEIRTNPKNRVLFDKNADYIIGYGELVYSGHMDSFHPFEIEIKYKSTSKVPTYMQITCSASKYGDYFTGGNGSNLWVDQLSFDYDY